MGKIRITLLKREYRTSLGNSILYLLARLVPRLPLRATLALGRGLGWLAPHCSHRHLRRVSADIARAFNADPQDAMVRRIAIKSYCRLGESLVEFLRIPGMRADEIRRWARIEGIERIDAALAHGKGVVMLTAHIGNWELSGTRVALEGYPLTAIARPQNDAILTNFLTSARESHGLKIVSMTDVRECIRVLKRNECLGILGDLNARPPGAFVQFFGRPAATYLGTAYLAQVSGAVILPVFTERLPDNTHVVRVGRPIPQSNTGDRKRDLLITTMRAQEAIEREVRHRPEDWYWLLNRWKTRPDGVANSEHIPMEHRDMTPEEAAAIRNWTNSDLEEELETSAS
ncbi:MAG TPA: lysophospholipid acyltransferase family protein [Armatimonadota bacterium]|nr:lysophospholipid acyltransferase family protein [Armatimonadota bacterium]